MAHGGRVHHVCMKLALCSPEAMHASCESGTSGAEPETVPVSVPVLRYTNEERKGSALCATMRDRYILPLQPHIHTWPSEVWNLHQRICMAGMKNLV